ncbi:hypothetical protein RJ639_015717 [Escallonia herrerae]|uniref:Retrotransposon Copia-like N-terminal domain-containing protein n=1 Tax=Escallonia herrerae TaxID=1293975 RepID=A0AA89AMS0_9ASTE|nr:hypothetical protein RJ639_015717 [Escallonia herrerae]
MSALVPQNNVSQPINIILDGPNYPHWAQAMRSFLKGRKLWLFISGDRTKPLQCKDISASSPESGLISTLSESDEDFANRLEDWDSINHRIITWFSNTSIASINISVILKEMRTIYTAQMMGSRCNRNRYIQIADVT